MIAKKRVLVVDDSALVRKKLGDFIRELDLEVDFAKNGQDALNKIFNATVEYDLVTLDINMPVLDGLSTLKQIMKEHPLPVLMVSSLTDGESKSTFEALEEGAVDFVAKPGTFSVDIEQGALELKEKIKSAIRIPKKKLYLKRKANRRLLDLEQLKYEASTQSKTEHKPHSKEFEKLVVIGASTGGPKLIETIATILPAHYAYPILVAQHMPPNFTHSFAQRLNQKSDLEVIEASNNLALTSGMFVIAKGAKHMALHQKASGAYYIRLMDNFQNHFFTPSVDELFESVVKYFNAKNVLAIELTGIGSDGAQGLLKLKQAGAYTIAQSQESATVYGMPKEAMRIGAAVKQLDFEDIVQEIINFGKE